MTSPSLMHEAGHSKPVHRGNPDGWDGEGCGRRGSEWRGHMYTPGLFMSVYGQNHHNTVK